jgi:hypothetical protein
MAPYRRSKSRKLRGENRPGIQRSQEAHNFGCLHPAGKQFFHHGFGVGARKGPARFQLLDQ